MLRSRLRSKLSTRILAANLSLTSISIPLLLTAPTTRVRVCPAATVVASETPRLRYMRGGLKTMSSSSEPNIGDRNLDLTKLVSRYFKLDGEKKLALLCDFAEASSEGDRMAVLKQTCECQGGLHMLIDMRKDILELSHNLKSAANTNETGGGRGLDLDPRTLEGILRLEEDLHSLFKHEFGEERVIARRIEKGSDTEILDILMKYESVHTITDKKDLFDRLGYSRRCFGLFHPKVPGVLAFVHVALTDSLTSTMEDIIGANRKTISEKDARYCIFYSISSVQPGLSHVSLGQVLLHKAIPLLKAEFANVSHFSTLSPIPKFRAWLSERIRGNEKASVLGKADVERLRAISTDSDPLEVLARAIEPEQARLWVRGECSSEEANRGSVHTLRAALKPVLLRQLAHYFLHAKRGQKEKAFDPVANFHLGNGAVLAQLNWLADTSDRRICQSLGMMVNYVYDDDPGRREGFRESYLHHGNVTSSREVRALDENDGAQSAVPKSKL